MAADQEACTKKFCHKVFIPNGERWTRRVLKKFNKRHHIKNAKTFKYSKKQVKDIEAQCKLAYCNPTCKGTLFQKGKSMPSIAQVNEFKGKNKKLLMNFTKKARKNIFKGKTNVLKNGFYEKLSSKTRKILKEKGAISGCAVAVPFI